MTALERALTELLKKAIVQNGGNSNRWQWRARDIHTVHRLHDPFACTIDEADADEHAMREYTDDQAIHIGYAIGTPETRWLPMEQHLALLLRDRLLALTVEDRTLGAGPDGKLLIALRPVDIGVRGFARCAPAWVVSSVQHLVCAPTVVLERSVRERSGTVYRWWPDERQWSDGAQTRDGLLRTACGDWRRRVTREGPVATRSPGSDARAADRGGDSGDWVCARGAGDVCVGAAG